MMGGILKDWLLYIRSNTKEHLTGLTGLESRGRPVQGWNALVAVPSIEWRFCFFQLLHGFKGKAGGLALCQRQTVGVRISSGTCNNTICVRLLVLIAYVNVNNNFTPNTLHNNSTTQTVKITINLSFLNIIKLPSTVYRLSNECVRKDSLKGLPEDSWHPH